MNGRPAASSESRRRRIGYVCQWWSPELVEAVPGRWAQLLRELGNDVVVVTGPPMDLRTGVVDSARPWWRRNRTNVAGFPTAVFPFFPDHSSSALKRIAMYATFAASTSLSDASIYQ